MDFELDRLVADGEGACGSVVGWRTRLLATLNLRSDKPLAYYYE